MSDSKRYKYHCYIAGMKTPILSVSISSGYGTLASANIAINYSPYITCLQKFTKIEVYEVLYENGIANEPTLEFDGILIGISRNKNVLGNVSVSLQLSTTGVVWNQRKQYDFYLQDLINIDNRGDDNRVNMRADGQIQNFIGNILDKNRFDVGCAACAVLTSLKYGTVETQDNDDKTQTKQILESYFTYTYNGKQFEQKLNNNGSSKDKELDPPYYSKTFLQDYKLANKVYGVSTSSVVKDFFRQDRFIEMIKNNNSDLYGENTLWTIATKVLGYGFYDVFDIPNPCYIGLNKLSKKIIPLESEVKDTDTDLSIKDGIIPVTALNRTDSGLAEYIFKPRSVIGIPLKCNVIWPDQVISESLYYNYFGQPTRILLNKNALPGRDTTVLSSTVYAGPHYPEKADTFFKSFNTPKVKFDNGLPRSEKIRSDYEDAFGLNASRISMGYAFDEVLLGEKYNKEAGPEDRAKSLSRINNFLNYEFAQKFLSTRTYQVQVTPEVNPVCGASVVIMSTSGEHIIAFCLGVNKSWEASGRKSVTLTIGYPRFHYENLSDINNVIDPTATDPKALAELEYLLGSESITGIQDSNNLTKVVEDLFIQYLNNKSIKDTFKRKKICTFNDYMSLFGLPKSNDIESTDNYGLNHPFDSTEAQAKLTTNVRRVFDPEHKTYVQSDSLKNSEYITLHNEWISKAQRI